MHGLHVGLTRFFFISNPSLCDLFSVFFSETGDSQLNMRGVFLHVLGDALGSVIVIISALIIWLTNGEWRFYVDPAMSLIIVVIITITTIPLCK